MRVVVYRPAHSRWPDHAGLGPMLRSPCASSPSARTPTTATSAPAASRPNGRRSGHKVRFVAVTNGDAGHMSEGGGAARYAAPRRGAGSRQAASASSTSSSTTMTASSCPSSDVRQQIIRQIREWKADLVLAPRPNDYHPDHRYTGVLRPGRRVHGDGAQRDARHARRCGRTRCSCTSRTVFRSRHRSDPTSRSSIDDVIDKKIDGARRARVADVRVAAMA